MDKMVGTFKEAIRPYLSRMDYQAVAKTVDNQKESFESPYEEFNALWAAILALHTTGSYMELTAAEKAMNAHTYEGPVKLGSMHEFSQQGKALYDAAVLLGSTTTLQQYLTTLAGELQNVEPEFMVAAQGIITDLEKDPNMAITWPKFSAKFEAVVPVYLRRMERARGGARRGGAQDEARPPAESKHDEVNDSPEQTVTVNVMRREVNRAVTEGFRRYAEQQGSHGGARDRPPDERQGSRGGARDRPARQRPAPHSIDEPCHQFRDNGTCSFGDQCRFQH